MKLGLVSCIQQIAVGEVLDDVSPGIAPVIEDLAAQHVSTDAGVVVVLALHQVVVARHERIDVLDLELRSLRSLFAFAPQEPFLFAGSIRDNLAFARPGASDPGTAQVVEAPDPLAGLRRPPAAEIA